MIPSQPNTQTSSIGNWLLAWAVVVALHIGFALALAHLQAASMTGMVSR